MKTENVSTLKIHKLTQEQYDRELAAGNIDANALYLTPDEEVDLSGLATKDEVSSTYETKESAQDKLDEAKLYADTGLVNKADKVHNHDTAYDTKGAAETALDTAKEYTDTKTANFITSSTVDNKISTHNTSTSAHNDIRDLINGLSTRLNALADSDDETLDQMSEIVEYIKANKALIDSVTTSKVSVSDIIDNLTTNVSNKPLSAAQGVAIKALIDEIETGEIKVGQAGHADMAYSADTASRADTAKKISKITTNYQTNSDFVYDFVSTYDPDDCYYLLLSENANDPKSVAGAVMKNDSLRFDTYEGFSSLSLGQGRFRSKGYKTIIGNRYDGNGYPYTDTDYDDGVQLILDSDPNQYLQYDDNWNKLVNFKDLVKISYEDGPGGVYTEGALFGEHNKPSGSFTGTGSERTIYIGGIGRVLFVYSLYNTNAFLVSELGSGCLEPSNYGSSYDSEIISNLSGARFENGVLYLPSCSRDASYGLNLPLLNVYGEQYRYQVL